nr:hypothetical protein [Tanacetum cinerariifolium]
EHLESISSQPQEPCNTDAPESSGNLNPTATSTNPSGYQVETLTVESPIPTVSSPVPTVCFTDSQEPSSKTRLISKRVTNQVETTSLDNILTLTNQFEDTLGVEPKKISDALQDPSWVEAMQEELLQFKIQNVWTLVDCPKGVRPIGTKWVLKNKKDERGIVIRNKARIVAQGHTQEEGIDYDEVFAPVARIKAIRLFLCYASFMGFTVYQMDVNSAFLYDPSWVEAMQEELLQFKIQKVWTLVYCPKGEEGIDYDEVFAPVARIEAIRLFLAYASFMGFIVYQMDVKSAFLYGTIDDEVEFEALLHEKFQMSAMGKLNFFLGLQVLQKEDGIFLSQDKYVGDILKKFGYSDVRSSNTPMDKENP